MIKWILLGAISLPLLVIIPGIIAVLTDEIMFPLSFMALIGAIAGGMFYILHKEGIFF